jgi:hypothetical protein
MPRAERGLRAVSEQNLRRHLDEAHRQLLQRDNAYRFHEEELRTRDVQIEQLRVQIEQLREQLARAEAWALKAEAWARELEAQGRDLAVRAKEVQAWAQELEVRIREMQATRAWRFADWLRSLRAGVRGLLRLGK